MPWNDLANNQTISFTNLKDAVDTRVLSQKFDITPSSEQITKLDAELLVHLDTSFLPFASKSFNQLLVKSNIRCTVPVTNTQDLIWRGIANNETTFSPIQLISGRTNLGGGRIFRSTDYGINYSSVLVISDGLRSIKFMPNFRHASFLTVPPFLSVGANGRIVTNSVTNASTWVTVSSPTTQTLYDIAFNAQVGVIVGDARILRTTTNNRINAWTIANSNANIWRGAATNGSIFVVVGENNSIITGNSTGTTWTPRSMPPLSPAGIFLYGVTFHSDNYFYAVGATSASASYIMRSLDGITWEVYTPGGDSLTEPLFSVISIASRLVIGGRNTQHQIINDVVTTCGATTGGVSMNWVAAVKDANSTNGFDMAGDPASVFGTVGAYSNF
jgi:hypothetical protein